MKIFLDTADTEVLNRHYVTGLLDGVTTNPTLIRKSGRDPLDVYEEIAEIGFTDISMEVGGNGLEMVQQGRALRDRYGSIATIKVPCTPEGLWACRELKRDLINVNVTLIFSASQAILAAKAGARYVSPFAGRLNDNSFNGLGLITDINTIYTMQGVHETQILSASLRDVSSVSGSFAKGADICTIPPSVFEKMYDHVLTDKGLDQFNKDLESIANANNS
ncbi:MAG: fructose-6-phosphate aldolase [Rhodobiaceae bacterium]|nr:fructose-6-phosphate aldolase [Rhodobiaceae bacterium]